MDIGLIFPLVFIVVCVIGLMPTVRRIWRGDERTTRRMRNAFVVFPVNSDVRQAMVRAVVALLLQLSLMLAAMIAMVIGMARWDGGSKVTLWTVSGIVAFAAAMAMVAVQAAIVWFNRPRFLVPPPLRGEAGVWADRKAAKRLRSEMFSEPG